MPWDGGRRPIFSGEVEGMEEGDDGNEGIETEEFDGFDGEAGVEFELEEKLESPCNGGAALGYLEVDVYVF